MNDTSKVKKILKFIYYGAAILVILIITLKIVFADKEPPVLTSLAPQDEKNEVPLSQDISLTFSEEIKAASMVLNHENDECSGSVLLSTDDFKTCVPFKKSLIFSDDKKTIRLTPVGLSYHARYSIKVQTGITDLAGNSLEKSHVSMFETRLPFSRESRTSSKEEFSFTLAEQIDLKSVTDSTFYFKEGEKFITGSIRLSGKTGKVVFTPEKPFKADSTYTAMVASTLKDINGNHFFPEGYQWEFFVVKGYRITDTNQQVQDDVVFGEDSDYKTTYPSFNNNMDGTITDNASELIWQKDFASTTMIHKDAITYCQKLKLGGRKNWRLPSVKELSSIIVFNNTPFEKEGIFWTRDELKRSPPKYHRIYTVFMDGRISTSAPEDKEKVKCVRGKNRNEDMEMIPFKDGTILDLNTGLMWWNDYKLLEYSPYSKTIPEKDPRGYSLLPTPGKTFWHDGISMCEESTYAGYSDWRLPNIKELISIFNYDQVIRMKNLYEKENMDGDETCIIDMHFRTGCQAKEKGKWSGKSGYRIKESDFALCSSTSFQLDEYAISVSTTGLANDDHKERDCDRFICVREGY